jgi:hypothetical protein
MLNAGQCLLDTAVSTAVMWPALTMDGKRYAEDSWRVIRVWKLLIIKDGGEGEIRTPDTLSGTFAFEASAFNRSATSPYFFVTTRMAIINERGAGGYSQVKPQIQGQR